jgi:hypothetical protein
MNTLSALMANAGQIEKAVAIEGTGIVPRLALAVAYSRIGQRTRAVTQWNDAYSKTKSIRDSPTRDFMLSKAAMALAQMNRLRWAKKIADECSSPIDRLDAYTVILAEYTGNKRPNLRGAIDSIVFYPGDITPARP